MMMKRFTLLPEHLKLLQRMYTSWDSCEFGAPTIDCKRPYGNSDVLQDMLEILGISVLKPTVFKFQLFGRDYLLTGEDQYNIDIHDTELIAALLCLHKETQTALSICLITQSFVPGIYEAPPYTENWSLNPVPEGTQPQRKGIQE